MFREIVKISKKLLLQKIAISMHGHLQKYRKLLRNNEHILHPNPKHKGSQRGGWQQIIICRFLIIYM